MKTPVKVQKSLAPKPAASSAAGHSGLLQRNAPGVATTAAAATAPAVVHEVLRSPGRPLDTATRAFFEPRFARNFARVPVTSAAAQVSTLSLTIGEPSSVFEHEADRMADAVMRPTSEKTSDHSAFDLSSVRIHAGPKAAESARAVNAHAYTVGNNIVFGENQFAPGTHEGRKLIAHELTHTFQQQAGTAQLVQRFEAEDAADEMAHKHFTVDADLDITGQLDGKTVNLKIPKGHLIEITAWSSPKTDTVNGIYHNEGKKHQVVVPKRRLVPIWGTGLLLYQYSAGVSDVRARMADFEKQIAAKKADIAAWDAEKAKYTTEKGLKVWEAQKETKETELADLRYKLDGSGYPGKVPDRLKRDEGKGKGKGKGKKRVPITPQSVLLNQALIKQTMFNFLDPMIFDWVDRYNKSIGVPNKWPPLDPNIVKSMIYNESHMGTGGEYLEKNPTPFSVATRFNVGQAIDSSEEILLMMMDEIDPDMRKRHGIVDLVTKMHKAQTTYAKLKAREKELSAAEVAEFKELKDRSEEGTSWRTYFLTEPGFNAAVEELFAGPKKLNFQYDFWIHAMVRWLFEKRKGVKSWEEAVKAYNGSGGRAEAYKKSVVGRAAEAKQASEGNAEFIPQQEYK